MINRKVVDNVENYLNMKFQTKIIAHSPENAKKKLTAVNMRKQHTIFATVLDNDPMNIFANFEACI